MAVPEDRVAIRSDTVNLVHGAMEAIAGRTP